MPEDERIEKREDLIDGGEEEGKEDKFPVLLQV
jgi:hypothetical protein